MTLFLEVEFFWSFLSFAAENGSRSFEGADITFEKGYNANDILAH